MAASLRSLTAQLTTADRTAPDGRPRSIIAQVADGLTLLGVFFAPMLKLVIGGGTLSDALLALVIVARVVQFMGPGLDFAELRRHAFLLSVLSLYAISGFVTGIVKGYPTSPEHIVVIFATLGSVLIVATYIRDDASITRLVKWFALGTTSLAVTSILTKSNADLGRAAGLTTHPNFLGHSCITGFAAAAYMFERADTRRAQRGWLAAMGILGIAMLRSGSRGALLGLAVAGLLYLCLTRDRRYVVAALGVAYVSVMAVSVGFVQLPEGSAISRLTSKDEFTQGSNTEREQRLDEALAQIRHDPVFGAGSRGLVAIHVVYLQAWVGAGAVGAFAIMFLGASFVVWPFFQPRRSLALACGATAVAVAWTFTNLLGIRDQWLFLAIAMRATTSPLQLLKARHELDDEPTVRRHTLPA